MSEFTVKWLELDSNGEKKEKEKGFANIDARNKFVDELAAKETFDSIICMCDPKEKEEDGLKEIEVKTESFYKGDRVEIIKGSHEGKRGVVVGTEEEGWVDIEVGEDDDMKEYSFPVKMVKLVNKDAPLKLGNKMREIPFDKDESFDFEVTKYKGQWAIFDRKSRTYPVIGGDKDKLQNRVDQLNSEKKESLASRLIERNFDLMHGHLGNGITVFNRAREVSGDYEKIAHIGPDRKVNWWLTKPTKDVYDYVMKIANGPNPSITANQPDQKVFYDESLSKRLIRETVEEDDNRLISLVIINFIEKFANELKGKSPKDIFAMLADSRVLFGKEFADKLFNDNAFKQAMEDRLIKEIERRELL